jgi:DNA modification methylase
MMKPDFQYKGIKLYCMDNMEVMESLPDKWADLGIVDPPYGINAPKQAATPAQRKQGAKRLN